MEASQDGPYLFQALLYGENLQKKTRTWTHMVTAHGFSELMPPSPILLLETVTGWYIGRVDNWTGRWDNIAKTIDSSKNIVLYNATVGNKGRYSWKRLPRTRISSSRVQQDKENLSLLRSSFKCGLYRMSKHFILT